MERPYLTFKKSAAGFTIVELMIATLVFSVILTVITAGVLSFTNQYYRGVHASATQNTAQSILDTISQSIQFGSAAVDPPVVGPPSYFCTGGYVFVYKQGAQYLGATPSSTNPGLYIEPMSASCAAPSSYSSANARQLLSNRMRLSQLNVNPPAGTAKTYTVTVIVAYGDNDLLCAPTSTPDSCSSSAATLTDGQLAVSDIKCKVAAGSQYCAVSKLTSSVQKRI